MSDAIHPTFLRRLRYTPLTDLFRGRVSGRLDPRSRVDYGTLPPAARELVRRVVRRTRLWPRERIDVALELVSHFADGIAAGESADDLVAAFGDESRAARLIRRAKVRNRPLAWKAFRFLRRLAAALLVIYALLAVRYAVGKPRVSVDYVAVLNAPIDRTPADQRAWPVYADALVRLGAPGIGDRPGASGDDAARRYADEFHKRLESRPGGKRWPELTAWLDAHAADVEMIRRGAARPSFGFVLGPNGSQREWPLTATGQKDLPDGLIGVLLPTMGHGRSMAEVLAADARLARDRKDGGRVVRDVEAILALGDHLRTQFLVGQLVAMGVDSFAMRELDAVLADAPAVLGDAELVRLAHRLAVVGDRVPLVDLATERMLFYDCVQRAFTDDGDGDGRFTPAGVRLLLAGEGMSPSRDGSDDFVPRASIHAVASLGVMASRREMIAEYDRLMDLADAQFRRPAREADWTAFRDRLADLKRVPSGAARYLPIGLLTPAVARIQVQGERALGKRDGLLAGIALELHRRRTGGYPATLDALTPTLLPTVPVDRVSGGPLRYKLVDGKPVVYSVGADRDDDGGRVAADRHGLPDPLQAADWPQSGAKSADGDWVLYPEPATPVEEGD